MAKKKQVLVDGLTISIDTINANDYINLTDIAKKRTIKPDAIIQNWLKNQNTIKYLWTWESLHNPDKTPPFEGVLATALDNSVFMSPKKWIELTGAVGIKSKSGRGGGTFAHTDIALNFMYWLDPRFQVYFIKEFQRLKEAEAKKLGNKWSVKRELAKGNYAIHTEAVKTHLIPSHVKGKKYERIYYASEADLLNIVVFGMTAKEWQKSNPNKKGNIRDNATALQLAVLANIEVLNASLIEWDADKAQRFDLLAAAAIKHTNILADTKAIKNLTSKTLKPKK